MAKKVLGELERKFFAYTQMREKRVIKSSEVEEALALSTQQVRNLFRRLTKGKLVARVRRGLYLVPEKLPLGGSWTPDERQAINALMSDCGGSYQICGPNAFNRYGYSEQIPVQTYIYNDKLSGQRTIGSVELSLIKVAKNRLGGTVKEQTAAGEPLKYSSRPRTLVDAVYDYSRFNSLPQAYDWIRADLLEDRVAVEEVVDMAVDYGNIGTNRRIGFLLEKIGVEQKQLQRLENEISDSSSFIPFVPNRPKRGRTSKRWKVADNEGE